MSETEWRKAGYACLTSDGKKLRIKVYNYTYIIPSLRKLRDLLDGKIDHVNVITPVKVPVFTVVQSASEMMEVEDNE